MSTREKLLALAVLIFFVCVGVWAVRTTPSEPPPIEKVEPPTTVEYEGNTIVEEQDGKIIWELTCSKMTIDSITQNAELDDVVWKFNQYDKEKTWELKAAKGIYYQAEKFIHVEGDVSVTNSDEDELLCEKIDWFFEQQNLNATGNIIVTRKDGAKLLCEKLDWFSAEENMIAEGNVKVDNNDGAKLSSDKLSWFTAEEKIIAEGNVKISKDDMRAFGDMAYSDNDFKHFGLMGNAKVLKGVKDNQE